MRPWCAGHEAGGIDGIALTKLDVLDGFPELKICTGYRSTARRLATSRRHGAQAAATPVYETMDGWAGSTRGARLDRPAGDRDQVRPPDRGADRAPVALLSTSPERDDTILVRDPFAD